MPAPKDLIHETTTDTGTGPYTVAAVSGKVRFSDTGHGFGTDTGDNKFDVYISNRAAAQWLRGTAHMSDANTLTVDTVVRSSAVDDGVVSFSAGTKDVTNDVPAQDQYFVKANGFSMPLNLGLAASAGSSALTISIKGADGNDPSATNPVRVPFRNVTAATGTPEWLSVIAATSLVVSSGSTLGVTSSQAFRLWVVGFNDGGTFRLGVINCSTGPASGASRIYSLNEWSVASSTAEGGAGAADSAGVFYTGSAVTSKAYRILGFIEWSSSGLTAGTWTSTNLNRIQLFGPGVHKPGDVVQTVTEITTSDQSTSSTTYVAPTGFDTSITPISAANLILVDFRATLYKMTDPYTTRARLSRGTTNNSNLIGNETFVSAATGGVTGSTGSLFALDKPNTTSAQAYTPQIRSSNASGTAGVGNGDAALMILQEIMG